MVHRLDNVVCIEQAEYVKGAGGSMVPTWRTWRTGIRARIQPKSAEVEQRQEALQTVKRFLVYVLDDVTVDHRHRLRGADGTIYRVCGSTQAQRIEELQIIEVEQESEG